MKKTKILATLGPAIDSEEMLKSLYKAWVNVIRFNFSHANYESSLKTLEIINRLNASWETNFWTLLDTKWPEIRTWDLEEKKLYKKWEQFKIFTDKKHKITDKDLFCDYEYLQEDIKVWQNVVIDSWLLSVEVLEKQKDWVVVKANNDAIIWSRRHVNLPWVKLKLPWITEKDKEDITFAIENKFNFIAASFIRSAKNVKEIRKLFKKYDCDTIKIISKIENQEWVDNLYEIVEESDGIMVARWDLWIEVPIEKLPVYQKEMVRLCKENWKMVIIATHLLETMIENPFPTRAESSDVFNSVMQKPDCLMLSWETSIWKFPLEAVKIMTSVIKEAEKHIVYKHKDYSSLWACDRDIEKKALIKSWLYTWEDLWASAMVLLTKNWILARLAASFRPNIKVYTFTNKKSTVWISNLLFWINPILLDTWDKNNYLKTLEDSIKYLLDKKLLKKSDKIVAINDIQKDGKEIPVMEIINLSDFNFDK